jgi:hypothetical protein
MMAPMKKKRQKKVDPDVVYTQRDERRATGNADEDEFDEAAEVSRDAMGVYYYQPLVKTLAETRRERYAGAKKDSITTNFPFMTLPAEIRNMIYRYIVLSRSGKPINLGSKLFYPGGIQTALLVINRQVSWIRISIGALSSLKTI